jgi:Flp pilus assembly protein TadG
VSQPISRRGDRGSATLEIAILWPAILLVTVAVAQSALWFYARSLALAAAQSGVAAGRSYGASPDDATRQTTTFLAEQAGDSLADTSVTTIGSTATVIRVEVTGRCLSVFPGFSGIGIRQFAQAERERFVSPVQGQP